MIQPRRSASAQQRGARRGATFVTALVASALLATGCRREAPARRAPAESAAPGRDLIISRLMADPTAVTDDRGEWIEIANLGTEPANLRGWQLRSGNDAGYIVQQSLPVPSHGAVVLARNIDAGTNGGIRADLAYTGIALGNAGDWLALRDPRGVTVDSVAWSVPPSGRALEHLPRPAAAAPITSQPSPTTAPATDATRTRGEISTGTAAAVPAQRDTTGVAAPGSHELVVRVLDIGQGDAILIQNGGSTVLVDGGPDPQALGSYLDAFGLNGGTVDAVILTHPHADHYQGLRELFASRRHITVRFFWENQDPSPNATLGKLRDSIAARAEAGSLVYRDTDDPCANGTPVCTVTLKGGAKLELMRPDPQGPGANNRSLAIKLVGPDSASFTMWIAGDAEHEAIDWFERAGYQREPGMRADVMKADHHGSCNGVTDRYLDLVHPRQLVVSLGALNDYGHMHEQAKAAYARHGVRWYRTDQNGTITIRSAGSPGGGYTVSVERGEASASGPSDRRANSLKCRGMPD